jgi:hypothetical protein
MRGDGGAQQVPSLVDGAGLDELEQIVFGELFAQVVDHALEGARGHGLGVEPRKLFALAHVGGEAHHLRARVILLEPRHDHGGIEPARVGQHNFLDFVFRHVFLLG